MLRNDRNHSTTAVANDKNDNSIAATIAIDVLAMLVKQFSIKALLF